MTPFRFLHTADLHLGTPFIGLSSELPSDWLERVKVASDGAFQRIVDIALGECVDFVTIAGDLFDAGTTPIRVQLEFGRQLQRLVDAGIPVFLSHGNHDSMMNTLTVRWPGEVHLFSPAPITPADSFIIESVHKTLKSGTKVQISGFSYPAQSVYTDFSPYFVRKYDTDYAIGLYHGNVGKSSGHDNYCAVELPGLVKRGFDFWGLGHIHKTEILREQQPTIVYPGNPQGRHIGEAGQRGCYLVDVNRAGQTNMQFVSTATVQWQRLDVNVQECNTVSDVCDTVLHALVRGDLSCPKIVHLDLFGVSPAHSDLLQVDIRDAIRSEIDHRRFPIWIDRVAVKTFPPLDIATLQLSDSLLGEVLRSHEAYRNNPMYARDLVHTVLSDVFHSGNQLSLEHYTDEDIAELLDGALQFILRYAAEGAGV